MSRRLAAAFGAILSIAAPTMSRATLSPRARVAIDAMLECERPDGGWMYVCAPAHGTHGVTKIVNLGERLRSHWGVEPWDVVVLRSPGTPAAGLLLLEAWRRSGDESLLDAARRTGDLLLRLQLPSGGWFSETPVAGGELPFWFRAYVPWATLDDDVTTGSVRLLLRLFEATGDQRYLRGAERGVDLLVDAQLPSGAWPLTHRPGWLRTVSPSFEDLPSLNDAATASVIQTLLLASEVTGRPELLVSAERGGDWLASALLEGERGRGWAQQYDERGRPVPGRAFEPVALASWETRHALEALDALGRATGDPRWCPAIEEGAAWLQRSALAPGCWARFVSPETGEPIYLDIDGNPVQHPRRAKRPYRWTGDFGIPALLTRLGGEDDGSEVVPRIPGDAGDCPGTPRSHRRRLEGRNPRARIGEAASRLGSPPPTSGSPCAGVLTPATAAAKETLR